MVSHDENAAELLLVIVPDNSANVLLVIDLELVHLVLPSDALDPYGSLDPYDLIALEELDIPYGHLLSPPLVEAEPVARLNLSLASVPRMDLPGLAIHPDLILVPVHGDSPSPPLDVPFVVPCLLALCACGHGDR